MVKYDVWSGFNVVFMAWHICLRTLFVSSLFSFDLLASRWIGSNFKSTSSPVAVSEVQIKRRLTLSCSPPKRHRIPHFFGMQLATKRNQNPPIFGGGCRSMTAFRWIYSLRAHCSSWTTPPPHPRPSWRCSRDSSPWRRRWRLGFCWELLVGAGRSEAFSWLRQ